MGCACSNGALSPITPATNDPVSRTRQQEEFLPLHGKPISSHPCNTAGNKWFVSYNSPSPSLIQNQCNHKTLSILKHYQIPGFDSFIFTSANSNETELPDVLAIPPHLFIPSLLNVQWVVCLCVCVFGQENRRFREQPKQNARNRVDICFDVRSNESKSVDNQQQKN